MNTNDILFHYTFINLFAEVDNHPKNPYTSMNADKKRRGHPAYPPEEKRVTVSCRIHPSTKDFLKKKGLKPGRVLDRAVAAMKNTEE